MRIHFFTLGDRKTASSRVRVYWLIEGLERAGVTCAVTTGPGVRGFAAAAWAVLNSDVIVFQKRFGTRHLWLARLARLLGKRTFLDIDDAPSRRPQAAAHRKAARMAATVDGVFAGSAALADWARSHNDTVRLIDTRIAPGVYTPKQAESDPERVCLGWVGNGPDYADDLIEMLGPALEQVAQRHALKFKIVGGCGDERLHAYFNASRPYRVEIVDTLDWGAPGALAEAVAEFDIGVYPLTLTPFNAHKCGFKALEYMALGLPVVASDVGPIRDIVTDGVTGAVVDSRADWEGWLDRLCSSADLRRQMGQAGRDRVVQRYAIERSVTQLLAAVAETKPA